MLGRVNTRLQRCGPRCRVDCCALVSRAPDRLPVDEERDGVFRLRDTVVWLPRSDAGRCTGNNSRGYGFVLENPAADINMM